MFLRAYSQHFFLLVNSKKLDERSLFRECLKFDILTKSGAPKANGWTEYNNSHPSIP